MIQRLSNNAFLAGIFSALIIAFHAWTTQRSSQIMLIDSLSLLAMGSALNAVCRRFRIIGKRSHLPLVIFSLLSCVVFPVLSLRAMVVGFIWLMAVYFSFSSWEDQSKSRNNLIFIGVLLGIAQTLDENAVFLFIPFFVLFYQNAVLHLQSYLLSLLYFLLLIAIYCAGLFLGDRLGYAIDLIPLPNFEYGSFDLPHIRTFLPYVGVIIAVHLLNLRNYSFRYPNRSVNINLLFLYQLLIAVLLLVLTSAPGLFILLTLPASILLAVGFSFKYHKVLTQAAFIALVLASMAVSLLFNDLVLQF